MGRKWVFVVGLVGQSVTPNMQGTDRFLQFSQLVLLLFVLWLIEMPFYVKFLFRAPLFF